MIAPGRGKGVGKIDQRKRESKRGVGKYREPAIGRATVNPLTAPMPDQNS